MINTTIAVTLSLTSAITLDTQVALRAEIHRLQMEHKAELQRDQEQLQVLGDFSKDAAAVRQHNEVLTKVGLLFVPHTTPPTP